MRPSRCRTSFPIEDISRLNSERRTNATDGAACRNFPKLTKALKPQLQHQERIEPLPVLRLAVLMIADQLLQHWLVEVSRGERIAREQRLAQHPPKRRSKPIPDRHAKPSLAPLEYRRRQIIAKRAPQQPLPRSRHRRFHKRRRARRLPQQVARRQR